MGKCWGKGVRRGQVPLKVGLLDFTSRSPSGLSFLICSEGNWTHLELKERVEGAASSEEMARGH